MNTKVMTDEGSVYAVSLPRTLAFTAINFFILAGIFIGTLLAKFKIQYDLGDLSQTNYMKNAFIQGLGLAITASAVFAVIDILSGGFAVFVMFAIYPLVAVTMLVLSLIAPSFMNDISNTENTAIRISAFRLWSYAFWPWFVIGMLLSLVLNAIISYLGEKISRIALDMLTNISNTSTNGSINLRSLIGNLV